MGGDLVEEDHRGLAGELRHEARLGEHQADEQRLLLAGRAGLRRHLLRRVTNEKIGEMRAEEGAAGGGIARALGGEECAIAILDLAGGAAVEVALERAGEGDLGGRERAPPPPPAIRAAVRLAHSRRAAAIATPSSAISTSIAASQALVRRRLGEKPVAPAHRLLEGVEARAVLAVDGEHGAIEEAAALGCRAGEEAIHRRRQPEDAEMLEQRFGRTRRRRD